jgi:hypothetical protein
VERTTVDGKNIKYNIVKDHVSKIPTFIVLSSQYSALLNESVKITSFIVDYYDKTLHTVNVTVKTGEEGFLNVSALYPGSEIYNSSRANISIFFSRFSLALLIEAGNRDVTVNETVNFTGSVSGINTNYTIPLSIVADDISVQTISAVSLLFQSQCSRRKEEELSDYGGDEIRRGENNHALRSGHLNKLCRHSPRLSGVIQNTLMPARREKDMFDELPEGVDIKILKRIIKEIKTGSKYDAGHEQRKGKRIYRKLSI